MPVRHDITLELGSFGLGALRQGAGEQRLPKDELVRRAALHYLSQRGSGRAAVKVPRFSRDLGSAYEGEVLVTLELRDEEWAALRDSAAEEQVTLELLLRHAVLLYLADLERGDVSAPLGRTG